MILLSRFVPLAIQRGARVVLEVQAPLMGLMSAIPGVAQVVGYGDALPAFDLHAPIASLPMLFQTTVESIPARTPYLTAPNESAAIVDLEKPGDGRPLVGVCWAGNPSYSNDHNRSIPLSIFERLFEVADVRFICLQQNLRSGDDAILARRGNIDLTSVHKGGTLEDTAALISRLDLVITVDTAISHLAGALGRPVWILLPFSAYWVWLRERTDSPWYPTARLFRQSAIGDWKGVMERVAGELGKEVRSQNQNKPARLSADLENRAAERGF
jgi:ADP-heptose:LPS heptosyltransferase